MLLLKDEKKIFGSPKSVQKPLYEPDYGLKKEFQANILYANGLKKTETILIIATSAVSL